MSHYFHFLLKALEANLKRALRHVGGLYAQRYKALLMLINPAQWK
jgi:putative heme degradation protein